MMKNAPMDVFKFNCTKIYFGALSFENIYTNVIVSPDTQISINRVDIVSDQDHIE